MARPSPEAWWVGAAGLAVRVPPFINKAAPNVNLIKMSEKRNKKNENYYRRISRSCVSDADTTIPYAIMVLTHKMLWDNCKVDVES